MQEMRSILVLALVGSLILLDGCARREIPYGSERQLQLAPAPQQTWAVAPAVNLSGQRAVDPILQADLVYQQLQQVQGLTVIPVNRVAEVYAALRIQKVQSQEQAAVVAELLGADALLIPTVTAYDPYDPPKFGAALQLFHRPQGFVMPANIDPRELVRRAAPAEDEPLPQQGRFVQVVGMYDASNGTVREALFRYAEGRADPAGPFGPEEFLVSIDRYCGFVYHELIAGLLVQHQRRR